ncbi:hypothetical protein GDO86_003641 [Hymenochirus boettgeri]|uniref:FHA domain-containing protein n=1 Tax=Hymenochirus boettgeri TaxID=247094 RepID=A0A8T2KAH2_9PIPI|nr:hypothetical protein GDO86_003641 [Hymenochirus boettgeri]
MKEEEDRRKKRQCSPESFSVKRERFSPERPQRNRRIPEQGSTSAGSPVHHGRRRSRSKSKKKNKSDKRNRSPKDKRHRSTSRSPPQLLVTIKQEKDEHSYRPHHERESRERPNNDNRYNRSRDQGQYSHQRSRDRDRSRENQNLREQRKEREFYNERRRERRERDAQSEEEVNDDVHNSNSEGTTNKEKPNFELSGALLEDTNTFRGVVIKYSEPPEARIPKKRWRLYPFKNDEALPVMYIHRQSAYLLGRQRRIADIPIDHPSCSKQHAVLQYRMVEFTRPNSTIGRRVRPYIIDLGSGNGTYLNNQRIEPQRYYELKEKDVLKFGFSSREYVVLHESSDTSELEKKDDDDDIEEEDEETDS